MKKKLFLWILIFSISNNIQAQCINDVYIPDINFKNALLTDKTINTIDDGEISCSEATAVISLQVFSRNISDLTGIEAFTNLESLGCYQNNLTSLNIASNNNLINLNCGYNNIDELNITSNTNLEELDCGYNNIGELNIASNTNLKELYCIYNNLTTLNVALNTNLTNLNCANNNIDELNITSNTSLINLNCANNNIDELNVVSNTSLTYLYCHNNNLEELNVTSNSELITLYSSNNNLTCIQVANLGNIGNNWNEDVTTKYSKDCYATAGIADEVLNNSISIYPNPVNSLLTIQLNEAIKEITVYTLKGQQVLVANTAQINVAKLAKGLYFLKITTNNGKVGVKRFIKE